MKNSALLVVVCFGCGSNADVDLGIGITDRETQLSIVVDFAVHGVPMVAPLDDASAVLRVRDQRIPLVAATRGCPRASRSRRRPRLTKRSRSK